MKAYCPICERYRQVNEDDQRCKFCGNENTRPLCRMCHTREADVGGTCVHCESIKMDAEMERRF